MNGDPISPRGSCTREHADRPIRVLHVVDKLSASGSTVHGLTRLLSWWIPRFDPERTLASVVSLRGPDPAQDVLEKAGVEFRYAGSSKYDPGTLPNVVRLARAWRADLLHLHGFGGSTIGRAAGRITGIPCVIHEHVCDARIGMVQRLADRMLSRQTALAIAVSGPVRDFLVAKRSVAEDRVRILCGGVPVEAFNVSPSGEWRRRLGIPEDLLIVATIGRLHASKGLPDYLKAARRIVDTFPRGVFLVVGAGELPRELEREARELGLGEAVMFTGHCEDVPSLLAEVDVVAISSVTEGGPLTLFEAMAAGRPIAATAVGAVPEVLGAEEAGLVVPPGDVEALADSLRRLLEDPDLRRRLAKRARRAALRYDVEPTVRAVEHIYREILDCRMAPDDR